jgi:hypothetical protein
MYIKEIEWRNVNSFDQTQDREKLAGPFEGGNVRKFLP